MSACAACDAVPQSGVRREAIAELVAEGMEHDEVGRMLGLTKGRITQIMRDHERITKEPQ